MNEFVKLIDIKCSVTAILFYTMFVIVIFYLIFKIIKLRSIGQKPNELPTESTVNDIWLIPGPPELTFLQRLYRSFNPDALSNMFQHHMDMHKKYGPIAVERMSNIPILHLFDRNDIEKIIRYPSKYPFRPPTEIVAFYRTANPQRYASTGLVNEQGASWYNLRARLTKSITSPQVIQNFIPTLNEICDDFIDVLKYTRNADNVVENFQHWANLMGLEATCALMLGRRVGVLSTNPNEKILKLSAAVKQLFIVQRDSALGLRTWKYLKSFDLTYRKFKHCEDTIFNIISEFIDKALHDDAQSALEFNDDEYDSGIDKSVFMNILNDEELDIRERRSAIVDFIAAGIETFANTLSFLLYYITRNPKTQERIYDEFHECVNNVILQEHITNAFFTKSCITECYRISPTASCLARISEEDTILSGYRIKKGSVVLCHTMIASRDEENFHNANTYNPYRWLTSVEMNSNKIDGDTEQTTRRQEPGSKLVIPFGVGKRACPGRRFVNIELHIMLAKLVCAFKIDYTGELDYAFEFLLVPKPPVNIVFSDRL